MRISDWSSDVCSSDLVQRIKALGLRRGLPQTVPRILDILLDLPLFPSRSRVTELSFEQIVADHRQEESVDGAFLATPDIVDRRAHIVIDNPARNAAQHAEGVIMGVEQHLMGLQKVGAQGEWQAVTDRKSTRLNSR